MDTHYYRKRLPLYVIGFVLPIIVPILLVPTLDDAPMIVRTATVSLGDDGRLLLDRAFLERHFLFSRKAAWEQGRWWTALTHMFLHQDRDHLVSNLIQLIPSSASVYLNFGLPASLGVFLGGGIVNVWFAWGQDYQERRRLALPEGFFGKRLGGLWDAYAVPRVTGFLLTYGQKLGCSAGVSALEGLTVMSCIDGILSSPLGMASVSPMSAITVLGTLLHYSQEVESVQAGKWTGIDHMGHVSGFLFGVACYGVSKIASFVLANKMRRRRRTRG